MGEVIARWKYILMLWKAYFDTGYSFLSYPKWAFAILGIGSAIQGYSLFWLMGGAAVFGITCFLFGMLLFKKGFFKAQQEVINQYNLFMIELRKKHKIKSKIK